MDPELLRAARREAIGSLGPSSSTVLRLLRERARFPSELDGRSVRALLNKGLIERIETRELDLISEAAGNRVERVVEPVRVVRLTDAGRSLL